MAQSHYWKIQSNILATHIIFKIATAFFYKILYLVYRLDLTQCLKRKCSKRAEQQISSVPDNRQLWHCWTFCVSKRWAMGMGISLPWVLQCACLLSNTLLPDLQGALEIIKMFCIVRMENKMFIMKGNSRANSWILCISDHYLWLQVMKSIKTSQRQPLAS